MCPTSPSYISVHMAPGPNWAEIVCRQHVTKFYIMEPQRAEDMRS